MAEVKYVGLDDLGTLEQQLLKAAVEKRAGRIERMVHNELELVVHVKVYSVGGEKHKYSVHIRASWPGGTVVSDKMHDWDMAKAVTLGLTAIEEQLAHKFRT